MRKNLLDLLSLNQSFAEHELYLKYKIAFLNSVFLMAAVVAFGMGFYRWQYSRLMGMIDFGFAASSTAVLYLLKRRREKIELISSVAITLAYLLFLAIYLLAPYNTMRLSLFFLLSAAAFYLKGRIVGLRWLFFMLFTIVAVHLLPGVETGYSHIDIITTCLYLIALFLIFWNYETIREDQLKREHGHELQRLFDERWRFALEGAGDAIWDWNLENDNLNYSKSYFEMLGYAGEEFERNRDFVESLKHPDDRGKTNAELNAYLAGNSNEPYVSEYRLHCKDGSYKWVLCRGSVMQRNGSGKPQRMAGTHVDITERKLAQEELLNSRYVLDDERRLFQTILDNAPLGIWMLGIDGRLRFVNNGFCSATGISEERFLSATHYSDVLPPSITASCMKSDAECFAQNTPHISTEWLPFVDGREHLLEISKVRLLDKDGSIKGLIGLAADVTERKEHERQLEHIAHYDTLTGVPNRVLLADRMTQALARTKRDNGLLAVCYLDLDGFKPVNDSLGHEAGDKVLVEVTRRIKEAIREDDTVARLGGDEFVVLLVGIQVPEECVGSLQRLLEAINQPIEVQGQTLRISASIGVSLYPEDDQDAGYPAAPCRPGHVCRQAVGQEPLPLFDAANDLRARSHHELLQQIRHGLAAWRVRAVLPAAGGDAFASHGRRGGADPLASSAARIVVAGRVPARHREHRAGDRTGRLGRRQRARADAQLAQERYRDRAEHQHLGLSPASPSLGT